MAVVYAIVNQKGGVGKTTTAVNVAAFVALAGHRTLLIDMDPQGHATSGLGLPKAREGTVYDVLVRDTPLASVRSSTAIDGLQVVTSSIDLAGAEVELMSRVSRETVLARSLEPVAPEHDFIFIDAPPALGLLTLNCLGASDAAIVPIQCEYYALEGVSQLVRTADLVRRHVNARFEIAMVVLTMYDARARLSGQVASEVRKAFGRRVSPTVVPRNVRLSEAPSHGQPIALYDPRSRGAAAYRGIAQEVIADGEARAR